MTGLPRSGSAPSALNAHGFTYQAIRKILHDPMPRCGHGPPGFRLEGRRKPQKLGVEMVQSKAAVIQLSATGLWVLRMIKRAAHPARCIETTRNAGIPNGIEPIGILLVIGFVFLLGGQRVVLTMASDLGAWVEYIVTLGGTW